DAGTAHGGLPGYSAAEVVLLYALRAHHLRAQRERLIALRSRRAPRASRRRRAERPGIAEVLRAPVARRTGGAENLRALQEQLAEIRRAERAVVAAADPIARCDAPVDQRLVGVEIGHLLHAPIRDAAAELDAEMFDSRRTVVDDRDQQLAVDLVDVERARARFGREQARDRIGFVLEVAQVVRRVR